jgi:hypothetical protein
MKFHFDFSANQILWTITFAAELVLLVVLLGRDRARRFPWFTGSIIMGALLLLVSRLLFGRMAPITTSAIFLALSVVAAILGLMVVVEIARRAFASASRNAWIVSTLAALVLAVAVLILWGPWPARSTFTGGSLLVGLRTLQLFSEKAGTLVSLLGIELGIAVVLFGRRFHAGWRSHAQQIAIGLSTAGIAQLAVRIVWQNIATRITVHSQAEYQHALDLRDRIYNANNLVYFLVLVWWIVWLWLDEPGTASSAEISKAPEVESTPGQ